MNNLPALTEGSSKDVEDKPSAVLVKNREIRPESGYGDVKLLERGDSRRKQKRHRCTPKRETLLVILTISGVVLGVSIGFIIRNANPSGTTILAVKFPGEIFLRMLKIMIVPIVFTSVITALTELDTKKGGRMGVHILVYYLLTTVLAVVTGILLSIIVHPGRSEQTETSETIEDDVSAMNVYMDIFRNLFPDNIVAACFQAVNTKTQQVFSEPIDSVNGTINSTIIRKTKTTQEFTRSPNMLGLLVFCIGFGVILASLGDEGQPVTRVLQTLNKIFMKMMTAVIWCSPVGICSLIAGQITEMKNVEDIGASVGMYVVTTLLACLLHDFVSLPLIYFFIVRRNPYKLLLGMGQIMASAIGISSSVAILPVTMRCMERNLGVDRRVSQLVLPIGATVNMDAAAIVEAVACITIAQMHGTGLSVGQYLVLGATATFASVGASAIPGSAIVLLVVVVTAVGLPVEMVAIFWSVDWFVDRVRTCVNVYGDCIGATIVQHLNREYLKKRKENQEGMQMD